MSASTKVKEPADPREGFLHAEGFGNCALCGATIYPDQVIRKLPDGWNPTSKRRHGHRKCVRVWVANLEMRTGQRISLRVSP